MFNYRWLCLFLFFLWSPFTSAANYSWYVYGINGPGVYASPDSACSAAMSSFSGGSNPATSYDIFGPFDGGLRFICRIYTASGWSNYDTYRDGTSCPDEHTYNSQTGECIADNPPDPCADKAGESEPYRKSGSRGDGFYDTVQSGGKTYGVTPNQACVSSCEATLVTNCVYTISANTYICLGYAHFTGESCTAGPTSPEQVENYYDQEPEVKNTEEPCVYQQDAEGRLHCVSKSVVETQGQNCGTAGVPGEEQLRCFPKQAELDDKQIDTKIEEAPEPDGGKTTTKTDTATVTKCKGTSDDCTTTTTTTTTTTKTDGSGTTTKTEVTCKGSDCGSGSSGGGGGGGGDGSGSLQGCTDNDCTASGGSGSGGPDLEEAPGYGDSLSGYFTRIQSAPIVAAVTAISIPAGGSCPVFNETIEYIGSVSTATACDLADSLLGPLRYLFLAIWAFVAIRTTMSA